MIQVWVSCASVRLVGDAAVRAGEDEVEDGYSSEEEEDEEEEGEEEDDPIYTDEEYEELGQAFVDF